LTWEGHGFKAFENKVLRTLKKKKKKKKKRENKKTKEEEEERRSIGKEGGVEGKEIEKKTN
jgi:predicted N-acyltransferase